MVYKGLVLSVRAKYFGNCPQYHFNNGLLASDIIAVKAFLYVT